MEKYIAPELEVIALKREDVIVCSGGSGDKWEGEGMPVG